MSEGLWALLGTVVGGAFGIITMLVQNKHSKRENELLRREQFVSTSYQSRIESYSRLNISLLQFGEYLEKFTEQGNEFKQTLDIQEFSPLIFLEDLNNNLQKESLWLSKEVTKVMMEFINESSMGNSMALALNVDPEVPGLHNSIEEFCTQTIEKVEKVQDYLRKDIGINYLDDSLDEWNNLK